MKQSTLSKITRHLLRRGQVGQTIVILAFGFIILLGFVGIVTDVSLLFVRYSTLRRSVDAAAVSAAGQMRRAAPNADDIAKAASVGGTPTQQSALAAGYAYARNIATVNLAARQFIEFYGLNPSTVVVDSCPTLQRPNYLPDPDPANPPPAQPDPADPRTPLWVELQCDENLQPRKLVKVTAEINSPTVFLRLLGWPDIKLQASAISETAVLDVVMIFDGSESMANQTTYDDWKAIPQANGSLLDNSLRYVPPQPTYGPNIFSDYASNPAGGSQSVATRYYAADWQLMWQTMLGRTQDQMDADPNFKYYAFSLDTTGVTNTNPTLVTNANDPRQARYECRLRFFPAAGSVTTVPDGTGDFYTSADGLKSDDVRNEYTAMLRRLGILGATASYPAKYDAFFPAYNFYGCCNDPNGDKDFSDLICQPFRQVRDATLGFLDRIDFNRGDRVAYVVFDKSAYLVPPSTTGTREPMMTSQAVARDTLLHTVGVRSEPNFYADFQGDGYWDAFVIGGTEWNPLAPTALDSGYPVSYRYGNGLGSTNLDYRTGASTGTGGYNGTSLGTLNDYPVKENCVFHNAALAYPFSVWSSPRASNSSPTIPTHPVFNQYRYPNSFAAAYTDPTMMNPNLNAADWNAQFPLGAGSTAEDILEATQNSKANYSYEYRAGCGGSNVGAALRVANNALLDPDTYRLNGAVWVMVMLGDGAAAASDPVVRNGNKPSRGNPYANGYAGRPARGEYGGYGLCPYGEAGSRSALTDDNGVGDGQWRAGQPRCSDTKPETRHYCFDPRVQLPADSGNIVIDLDRSGNSAECTNSYDVDDFARDWADWIGLSDPFPWLVTKQEVDRSRFQLPTIFTIGFGIDMQQVQGTLKDCDFWRNAPDCIGEELLRYIADVGDNNRIDTDYQQDIRPDHTLDKNVWQDDSFGARGPCEGPIKANPNPPYDTYSSPSQLPPGQFGLMINPLGARQSCGNYFNAPTGERLQQVFDEIASRMFTRLTR